MRNNCARNGKVHVKARMCKTCIFRPGNLMHLDEWRVEDMVESAKKAESAIVCHSTIGTSENAVCRGFYNRHSTLPLRLAALTGNLKEVA